MLYKIIWCYTLYYQKKTSRQEGIDLKIHDLLNLFLRLLQLSDDSNNWLVFQIEHYYTWTYNTHLKKNTTMKVPFQGKYGDFLYPHLMILTFQIIPNAIFYMYIILFLVMQTLGQGTFFNWDQSKPSNQWCFNSCPLVNRFQERIRREKYIEGNVHEW